MEAVNESELLKGKTIVLRNIAADVSTIVGIEEKEWIRSRYWEIKKYAGFHHARVRKHVISDACVRAVIVVVFVKIRLR